VTVRTRILRYVGHAHEHFEQMRQALVDPGPATERRTPR
jgi:hypothetical protein